MIGIKSGGEVCAKLLDKGCVGEFEVVAKQLLWLGRCGVFE
jgi:hypothetical protein